MAVDRVVLFAALLVVAGIVELSIASSLRDYAAPSLVNGTAVAQRIDAEIGDLTAARYPAASVGAAQCPSLLDLTGERTARCTIPVDGDALRVEVSRDPDPTRGVVFGAVDALVVMPDAQRDVAASLAHTYGEQFDVRCPGAPVRVLALTERFVCSVEAPDVMRRNIEVRGSGYDGYVRPEPLEGVALRQDRVLGHAVTDRREGGVAIDGAALEDFVLGEAAFEARGEVGRRRLLGPARCPRRVVLKGLRHATCSVLVGDRTQLYDVRFDAGRGIVVDTQQTAEVIAVLREVGTAYFQRSTYSGGKPLRAHVDCGTALVALVEPGATLPCKAAIGDKAYDFVFRVGDAGGRFTIESAVE